MSSPQRACCVVLCACISASILPPCDVVRPAMPSCDSLARGGVWQMCAGAPRRISGEDHYSAFKPPRAAARYKALIDWSVERHPR